MMTRRRNLILATTAIAVIAAAPAAAQTADATSQTNPTSEAGATAVEIDGVATISGTSATRDGEGGGTASATVLELGGETVVGGTQEGEGESGGEVLTTGEDNEQGYLTVGGWDATVDGSSSDASSSVADGNLGGEEGASITVLDSASHAEDGASSAETTGVIIDLGGGQLHLEPIVRVGTDVAAGRIAARQEHDVPVQVRPALQEQVERRENSWKPLPNGRRYCTCNP